MSSCFGTAAPRGRTAAFLVSSSTGLRATRDTWNARSVRTAACGPLLTFVRGVRVLASCPGAGGPGTRSPAHARGRPARRGTSNASTPGSRTTLRATANGACARMPKPPTPPSAWRSGRHATRGACRAVVVPAGAGPIRGRQGGGTPTPVLMGCWRHAAVHLRERGPENAGTASDLPPRRWRANASGADTGHRTSATGREPTQAPDVSLHFSPRPGPKPCPAAWH